MTSKTELLAMIEKGLDAALPRPETVRPAELCAAMRHAVCGGGKRIRPLLCLAAAEAVGGKPEDALACACAIELLHNYTLVHDDLPAMDNDRERRGRPTVWAKYGEATAILAGDALLSLAFEVAASAPRNVALIVRELGEQGVGVVRGQVVDLVREGGRVPADDVDFVYRHKTADLFMAAAAMGALSGGGSEADVEALRGFALNLGLAFQYEDDLLDGDSPFPREETERRAREATAAAIAALATLPGEVTFLKELACELLGRRV